MSKVDLLSPVQWFGNPVVRTVALTIAGVLLIVGLVAWRMRSRYFLFPQQSLRTKSIIRSLRTDAVSFSTVLGLESRQFLTRLLTSWSWLWTTIGSVIVVAIPVLLRIPSGEVSPSDVELAWQGQVGLVGVSVIVVVFLLEIISDRPYRVALLRRFLADAWILPVVSFVLAGIFVNGIVLFAPLSLPSSTLLGSLALAGLTLIAIGGLYFRVVGFIFRRPAQDYIKQSLVQNAERDAEVQLLRQSAESIFEDEVTVQTGYPALSLQLTGGYRLTGEKLGISGYVADVNIAKVVQIQCLIDSSISEQDEDQCNLESPTIVFPRTIGDYVRDETLLLHLNRSLPDEIKPQVEDLLRGAIKTQETEPWVIEREPFHDDRETVKQRGIDSVTNRDYSTLEETLETQHDIVGRYLDSVSNLSEADLSLESWAISSIIDDQMDLYRAALDNEDETALQEILSTLQQEAFRARDIGNLPIFDSAFSKLRQSYQLASPESDIGDYTVLVIREVVIGIPDIASADSEQELAQFASLHSTAYSNMEWLIITAIRDQDELSFTRFWNLTGELYTSKRPAEIGADITRFEIDLDRTEVPEKSEQLESQIEFNEHVQGLVEDAQSEKDQLLFGAGAWLLHSVKEGRIEDEFAKNVFEDVVQPHFDSLDSLSDVFSSIRETGKMNFEKWSWQESPDDFGGARMQSMAINTWLIEFYCQMSVLALSEPWLADDHHNLPATNPISTQAVQHIPVQSVESTLAEIVSSLPWSGFYGEVSDIERRKNTIIALHRISQEDYEQERAQKLIEADLDDDVVDCYLTRFREGFEQRTTTLDVFREYGWIARDEEEASDDSKTLYYTPNYPKENFTTEYSEHRGHDFENAGESFADGVCGEIFEHIEGLFEERSLTDIDELVENIQEITENKSNRPIQALILGRTRIKSELAAADEYSAVNDSTEEGPVGYYNEIPVYRGSFGEFDALLITESESPVVIEYPYSDCSIEAEIIELTEDNLEEHLSDPADLSDEKQREWLQRVILRGKYRFGVTDTEGSLGYRLIQTE
jgi:hypothetical protein